MRFLYSEIIVDQVSHKDKVELDALYRCRNILMNLLNNIRDGLAANCPNLDLPYDGDPDNLNPAYWRVRSLNLSVPHPLESKVLYDAARLHSFR